MRRLMVILALALSTLSCSGASRDRMLHVFFDNPPEKQPVATDTLGAPSASPPVPAVSADVAAARSTHPPFADRDCAGCHASATTVEGRQATVPVLQSTGDASPAKLSLPVPELCYQCHDDMTAEALAAARKTVHSPVEDGDCTACHEPHRSRFLSLLKRSDPVETLCFECHDAGDVLGTDAHRKLEPERRTCTECHDPHAAAKESLLK